jgi:hypothetical protein
MRKYLTLPLVLGLAIVLGMLGAGAPGESRTHKRGGILNAMLAEDPLGLSIHESATISGVWPMAPCYSNLVIFDPLKPLDSAETVIPELAERWSWQDNYRNLVFFLRKNVRWRAAHARLAQRVLHPVAPREEPRPPQLAVQLRPHAGRLAGQIAVRPRLREGGDRHAHDHPEGRQAGL